MPIAVVPNMETWCVAALNKVKGEGVKGRVIALGSIPLLCVMVNLDLEKSVSLGLNKEDKCSGSQQEYDIHVKELPQTHEAKRPRSTVENARITTPVSGKLELLLNMKVLRGELHAVRGWFWLRAVFSAERF